MPATRNRLLYIFIGLTFGHLLTGAQPLAAQGDCKMVLDAMTKLFDTPTHSYVIVNLSGQPQTAEAIYAGGVVYAKYNGKWSAGTTTQEMKEMAQKNRQNNKMTRRYLKDEPVNGEMAAVYSVQEVSPKSTSNSTMWVSKTKGLPLRSDTNLNEGKSQVSTRYEYGNVKPPM